MNIYQEDFLLVITMVLGEEFIFGNAKSVNIYGLIVLSRRNNYSQRSSLHELGVCK
jgi:hypothetical protein